VYYWGTTSFSPVSFRSNEEFRNSLILEPTLIHCEKVIVDISLGSRHILGRTSSGTVYSAGDNRHLQLGYIIKKDKEERVFHTKFKKVDFFEKYSGDSSPIKSPSLTMLRSKKKTKEIFIKSIATGNYHSVALDSEGIVYFWGRVKQNFILIFINYFFLFFLFYIFFLFY
jgi:alpha-tubulin suppressor-like RCC1 family protein